MNFTEPHRFGLLIVTASVIPFLAVVFWLFRGNTIMIAAGVGFALVSAPVAYVVSKRTAENDAWRDG